MNKKEAKQQFIRFVERGIKWFYAEDEGEDLNRPITNEDWENYGEYSTYAVELFNKLKNGYKAVLFSAYTKKPINWDNSTEDGDMSYWDLIESPRDAQ